MTTKHSTNDYKAEADPAGQMLQAVLLGTDEKVPVIHL
jgi:hypothetical protein